MRQFMTTLLIICLCLIFTAIAFGESGGKVFNTVNSKTTIMTGDFVFNSLMFLKDGSVFEYVYKYAGKNGDTLKINVRKVGKPIGGSEDVMEDNTLELPLNEKKQALLKVRGIDNIEQIVLITVIDDFGSIKAEEYNR